MIRPLLWLPLLGLLPAAVAADDLSLQKRVEKLHQQAAGQWCEASEGAAPEDDFAQWTITYKPGWSDTAPEEEVTLIRVFCMAGAYNINHSYYIERPYDGLTPLAFAMPVVDPQYEGEDMEGAVLDLPVRGMGTALVLVNSEFDPESLTISAHSKWRGLGDASSTGEWQFREGEFVLVHYAVDASYDGEINPETVLDYRDRP